MATVTVRTAADSVSTTDLRLADARAPLTHTHTIAALPSGSVVSTSSTTTRPTTRADIIVIWTGATDPVSIALAGDMWLGTP